MISLNGEGGEIKDMIGKYPHTRGQQIASGRFGVNAELLNSSNLIEIKLGKVPSLVKVDICQVQK